MCNIYGPIIQILMCVFYFTRTESDVLTNRIQIFVSWSVVKQSKDKKKRREEEEEEEEKPTAEGLRCILYVAQQRNDVHKTLSLKRWYTLSYCLSCSANSSGKKNNSKWQVAYVDSESIHIHQSQEDRLGLIQHCLTKKWIVTIGRRPAQDQNVWQPLWLVQVIVPETRSFVQHQKGWWSCTAVVGLVPTSLCMMPNNHKS